MKIGVKMDKIDKIEIKDVDDKLKIVFNRDIIEDIYNKISTKQIALDTIRHGIRHNYKTGTLYASIDAKAKELRFSDKPSNSNTIIDVFSLDIQGVLDGNKTLEELYFDNFEGFRYELDVEEKLDKLYNR